MLTNAVARTFTHWQRQILTLLAVGMALLVAACSSTGGSGGSTGTGSATVHTGYQLQTYSTVVRGDTKWAILLCKFADHPEEPHTVQWYQQFMTEAGAGMSGLYDFYHDISNGNINLSGSIVEGWYTETFTLAQEQPKSRDQRISDCVNTAQNAATNPYTVPADYHTAVMLNAQVDAGSVNGRVELDPGAQFVAFAAHEMGHSYGAVHSFSDDNYQNVSWSAPGEYGNMWDVMSVQHVYWYTTPNFGSGGPGMEGYYLDKLGWLPHTRIYTFGADGATSATYTLAALNNLSANGPLMVRVPIDPNDLYHYYTVELRHKAGWDQSIPRDTVLINEIRDNGVSYLVNTSESQTYTSSTSYEWQPGMTFTDAAHQVSITVNSIDATAGTASITIQGAIAHQFAGNVYGPHTCIQGYVWREADDYDYVCVTPDVRAQAKDDNAQAASRIDPNGAYGPNTCINGYVWREAFPDDFTCVTPSVRSQAAADNAQAANRVATH